MRLIRIRNDLQLQRHFLPRSKMDNLSFGLISLHRFRVTIGNVPLLPAESNHTIGPRRHLRKSNFPSEDTDNSRNRPGLSAKGMQYRNPCREDRPAFAGLAERPSNVPSSSAVSSRIVMSIGVLLQVPRPIAHAASLSLPSTPTLHIRGKT